MYADAFVFIQGENMNIKCFVVLEVVSPIKIFLKNKTAIQSRFALYNTPYKHMLILLFSSSWHYNMGSLGCQQTEWSAKGVQTFTASF